MKKACDYCGEPVETQKQSEHYRATHPEVRFEWVVLKGKRSLQCLECGSGTSCFAGLVAHIRAKHQKAKNVKTVSKKLEGSSRTACDYCGARVPYGGKFEHFQKAHPEFNFELRRSGETTQLYCLRCGAVVACYSDLVTDHHHAPPRVEPQEIPQMVEQLINEGRDPRHELWDAIWESQSRLREKVGHLEAELVSANAELTALREERAENERLRIINKQLMKADGTRLLAQVQGALATPGEGSLVSTR